MEIYIYISLFKEHIKTFQIKQEKQILGSLSKCISSTGAGAENTLCHWEDSHVCRTMLLHCLPKDSNAKGSQTEPSKTRMPENVFTS